MKKIFFALSSCAIILASCAKNEDIGDLQHQINANDADIAELQARLDTAKFDIDDVQDQIDFLEDEFNAAAEAQSEFNDEVSENVTELQDKSDSLGAVLVVAAQKIDSLKSVTAGLEEMIDTLDAHIAQLRDDMDESDAYLQEQVDTINNHITKIEADIVTIKADIVALNTRVDNVITEVKKAFASMISSVVYINRNADHNTVAWYHQRGEDVLAGEKDTLDFLISPASAWSLFEKSLVKYKVQGSYDVRPDQKSSTFFEIPVLEFVPNTNEGIMSLVVDASAFDADFLAGKKSASVALYVENLVSGISSDFVQAVPALKPSVVLVEDELSINVGTAKQVKYVVYPEDAEVEFTYDSDIITVDSEGVVSAVAEGEAHVTVTAVDGGDAATVTVTTQEVPVVDLSADGTANCYIIPEAGVYTFDASVKGNSEVAIDGAVEAAVVWESTGTVLTPEVGCVIDSVSFEEGVVTVFTAPLYQEGNAVVAVKNAAGKILWSWHLWATEYDPSEDYDVYNGFEDLAVMNRELGVLSYVKGDSMISNAPLYYQWGRKDPFTYATVSTTGNHNSVITGINHGTIDYAVAHPETYITGLLVSGYDWVFSSRNNGLWAADKTMYDPCPAGWKVPESSLWNNFPKGYTEAYNASIKGWEFGEDYSTPATWYSCSGYYDSQEYFYNDAQLIWTANAGNICSSYLGLGTDGQVNIWTDKGRAYGMPVRCVEDLAE